MSAASGLMVAPGVVAGTARYRSDGRRAAPPAQGTSDAPVCAEDALEGDEIASVR